MPEQSPGTVVGGTGGGGGGGTSGGGTGGTPAPSTSGGGYIILSTVRTVEVVGANSAHDVMEITAQTDGHGVTFVETPLYSTWKQTRGANGLQNATNGIESIFSAYSVVASGSAVQTIDPSGLLVNQVEFVVSVPGTSDTLPGPYTDTVTIPVKVLKQTTDFSSYFDPVIAQLKAAAGG